MTEAECRRIVRERSGGVCEHCLSRRATSASHRKPRSQGGEWSPENIVDACGDGVLGCHGWLEGHPRDAHRLGWRLWRNEDPATVPFMYGGVEPRLPTRDGGWVRLPKVTAVS